MRRSDTEEWEQRLRETTIERWAREGRLPRRRGRGTAPNPEANIAHFPTRAAANTFIEEHNVLGWPHDDLKGWIVVFSQDGKMYAANKDGRTATWLQEW